jgi:uncharacterized protein
MRLFWTALGFINVALGLVGLLLPVMPTTIFLIIAAWCFAKGSPQRLEWLLAHARFGPLLRDWRERGAIPRRAKRLAIGMMSLSYIVTFLSVSSSPVRVLVAGILISVSAYILTRPDA